MNALSTAFICVPGYNNKLRIFNKKRLIFYGGVSVGKLINLCAKYPAINRWLLLIAICTISACAENQQSTDNTKEKPAFANDILTYIPFANSSLDKPPASIGLVDANNHNQSVKIVENSSSGLVDFLYDTAFNYREKDDYSPSLRDKDYNATLIYEGFYDASLKKVTNYHVDRFLFGRGGKLYQQKIWQTKLEDPQIISTETQFFKYQLCSISSVGKNLKKLLYVGHDFENVNNSVIIYKIGKFSKNSKNQDVKSCAANEVSWKLVKLGMNESSPSKSIQTQLSGYILQPINNITTGALEGWIASDASGTIHHFTADFSSSQQIPIPTHNGDSTNTNNWIVFLGIDSSGTSAWFATHAQHIYQYNILTKQLINPAGAVNSAIDAIPDSNHKLQVYGAYKNDRYPIYGFDENYLYILIHGVTAVAVQEENDQFQYTLKRIPLTGASATPEVLATFQAHDIGKMVLTQNKVVLSISHKSTTREGTEFLMFDKLTAFAATQNVFPASGHQCIFNIFTYKNTVYGNSVGLESCRKPTTNETHIHFFKFDETGQSSYLDSHHSRLMGTVNTHYDPFMNKSDLQYLIVKRNIAATNNTWIDTFNIYDPAIGSDIRTLGQIDIKNSAMTARVSLLAGFSTGLIEYQSRQGHQKLFTFSINSENSMIPFTPLFQSQTSNRWISPFDLPN